MGNRVGTPDDTVAVCAQSCPSAEAGHGGNLRRQGITGREISERASRKICPNVGLCWYGSVHVAFGTVEADKKSFRLFCVHAAKTKNAAERG